MLLSAPTQLLPRMIPCIIRLMSFISWIMNSKRVNGFKITRLTSTNNNQKNKMNLSKVPFKSASFIRIKVRPRNIAVSFCCEGRGELFILFKNFIPFFLCSKWFLGMQGGRTPFPAQRHAKTFQFLWLYVQLYRGGGNIWFCWKRELFLLATESELEFPEKLRFRFFFFLFLSFSTFIRLSNLPLLSWICQTRGWGVLWEQYCYSVCVSPPRPQRNRPPYVWSSKKYFPINYILKETVLLLDLFFIFWSVLSFSKLFWDYNIYLRIASKIKCLLKKL